MDRWRLNWFSTQWTCQTYRLGRTRKAIDLLGVQWVLINKLEDALTRPFGQRNEAQ